MLLSLLIAQNKYSDAFDTDSPIKIPMNLRTSDPFDVEFFLCEVENVSLIFGRGLYGALTRAPPDIRSDKVCTSFGRASAYGHATISDQ